MKRTPFKSRGKPLAKRARLPRGARLAHEGKSDASITKKRIQALLRAIVMYRDGGTCILQKYRHCNDPVKQCDHLITRGNSATYADTRLCVLVCRSCHAWKSLGSNRNKAQYDALVRTLLSKDRVDLWDRCEKDSWQPVRKYVSDWKMAELVLQQELKKLTS